MNAFRALLQVFLFQAFTLDFSLRRPVFLASLLFAFLAFSLGQVHQLPILLALLVAGIQMLFLFLLLFFAAWWKEGQPWRQGSRFLSAPWPAALWLLLLTTALLSLLRFAAFWDFAPEAETISLLTLLVTSLSIFWQLAVYSRIFTQLLAVDWVYGLIMATFLYAALSLALAPLRFFAIG